MTDRACLSHCRQLGAETQRSLQRYRTRLASKGLVPHASFFLSQEWHLVRPNTVSQALRTLAKRAGVSDRVNPHSFRHGFGVGYIPRGRDIRSLQQIMGHARVTTTEGYTHLSEESLAAMRGKFSPAGRRGS